MSPTAGAPVSGVGEGSAFPSPGRALEEEGMGCSQAVWVHGDAALVPETNSQQEKPQSLFRTIVTRADWLVGTLPSLLALEGERLLLQPMGGFRSLCKAPGKKGEEDSLERGHHAYLPATAENIPVRLLVLLPPEPLLKTICLSIRSQPVFLKLHLK